MGRDLHYILEVRSRTDIYSNNIRVNALFSCTINSCTVIVFVYFSFLCWQKEALYFTCFATLVTVTPRSSFSWFATRTDLLNPIVYDCVFEIIKINVPLIIPVNILICFHCSFFVSILSSKLSPSTKCEVHYQGH